MDKNGSWWPAVQASALDDVNPMAFLQRENMSTSTRMRMLEGEHAIPIFSSPEELANATVDLIIDHEGLTDEQARAEMRKVQARKKVMSTYLKTANLDPDEAKCVMAKSQMDLIVGEHDDPMVLAFEKNAKSSVDKMFKARAKVGKDKGDAVATAVSNALVSQAASLGSVLKNVMESSWNGGGGGRGGGGRGGGGGGDWGGGWSGGGRGRGKKGGSGSPGNPGFACFVCGSNEHRARDCPQKQ